MTQALRFFVMVAVVLGVTAPGLIGRNVIAQTSYPMLMSAEPVAAQVGGTSEHTVKSRYTMEGAYQVLVSGTGVTGEVVPPEAAKDDAKKDEKPKPLQEMKVRFKVDAGATTGVRDFRIATPNGVSTVGQLAIVMDKVITESDDNNNAEKAQVVELPATLCGRIEKAEDVDYFKFHVEAGKTLSFHVRCMRLQDRIHDLQQHADPIIAIRNASGSTVAASDNVFFGDPLISHTFDSAGDYFFEIRDVRYQGNQYWGYSVEISERPLVTTVYPLGVGTNQTTSLQLIGHALSGEPNSELLLDADTTVGLQHSLVKINDVDHQPVPIVVSDQDAASETEGENNSFENAQAVSVPTGINGRIESEGDIDCFVFEAKKDERYSFEVIARRAQSSLDPHLRILNEKGSQLQLNDDMRIGKRNFADSRVENWTVPADGKYIIEIRDLHLRGGNSFVYFVNATRSAPYFSLFADTDKTPLTPGTGGVVFVRAERKNGFDGEIQLHVDGLPAGVTANCGRILAGKGQDGCIVFRAAGDAKPLVSDIAIRGTATFTDDENETIELSDNAIVYQETYQPGGGRGHWPVESHVISVASPSDIRRVTASTYDVTLKPGESTSIDVEIERSEGFDKNVTLAVSYMHLSTIYGNSLPQGVTVDKLASKTALTAGATKGKITLKAAADAPPVDKQQIVVMANVSLNFVMKATYASDPIMVTVAQE